MISPRTAVIATLLVTGAAPAQTLDNKALVGKYFFRQIFVSTNANGNTTEVRSLLGTATFDGKGGFTFTGQQNIGSAAAVDASGSGTYAVSPAGYLTMTNPARTSVTTNARLGTSAIVGATTEVADNVFDVFVAIPAAAPATNYGSLSGAFWAADFEISGATTAGLRSSIFLLPANGRGAFSDISVTGHTPSQQGGIPFDQVVKDATYQMNGDGSGTVTIPGSQLIASGKTIFLSQDGNILLGGSTAAAAHDLLVAVKSISGGNVTNASWHDKFWNAGLRIRGTNVNAYSGSTASNRNGKLLLTRRVHAPGSNGTIDFTGVNDYGLSPDGSGSVLETRAGLGDGGDAYVGAGISIIDPAAYEIYFGIRLPGVSGTGVFLNPQGIVNTASFAPAGAPVCPGQFIALFGSGLAANAVTATTSTFPTTLGGVTVTVNNTPAPLYFVSANQIAALVPFSTQGPSATIVANNNGTRSNAVTVPVARTSPGVFSLDSTGNGPGAILHADFSVVNSASPAKRGETVLVYLTGLWRGESGGGGRRAGPG